VLVKRCVWAGRAGWSGAELAQLLQEAALVAVRHGGTVINRLDMDRALDRLTMGSERIGLQRRLPVHRRMATHETGLALTSHLLRRLEDAETEFCDRVSIVPRGEVCSSVLLWMYFCCSLVAQSCGCEILFFPTIDPLEISH
jgi:ATP-dependent Zn protease